MYPLFGYPPDPLSALRPGGQWGGAEAWRAELRDLAERGGTEAATSGTPGAGGGELPVEGGTAKKEKKEKKAAKEAAKKSPAAAPSKPSTPVTRVKEEERPRDEPKPAEDSARPSTGPEPDRGGKEWISRC